MSPAIKKTIVASLLLLAACSSSGEGPVAPTPPEDRFGSLPFEVDSVRTTEVAPGVEHSYIWSAEGPWAVNIVEAAPGTCTPEIRTRKGGNAIRGVARTSAFASALAQELGRPVLAAINGDFFSGDPYGAPIGPQVIQGAVVKGPNRDTDRPAFGITTQGTRFISKVEVRGEVRNRRGDRMTIHEVNASPPGLAGLSLYNSFNGTSTPSEAGVVEVVLAKVESNGGVNEGRGVVTLIDTKTAGVSIPTGGTVLVGKGASADYLQGVAVGDTLDWRIDFNGSPGPIIEMIGGYSKLVSAGNGVRTTGALSTARHPRSAIGWKEDGTFLLVTVDGRQSGYSIGMTFAEMTSLFLGLGAVEALNFDGGGSTTLVVDGRVVNRYSDAAERPVGNALLLVASDEPGC